GNAPWQPSGGFADPRLGGTAANTPLRPVPADGGAAMAPAPSGGSPLRPVAGTGAPPGPAAPLVPTGGGLDQTMRAVAAYHPLSQRLTFNSQTGEWLFEVKVPMPGNAAQVRVVEGTAPTPEAAVRLVLEQLSRGP